MKLSVVITCFNAWEHVAQSLSYLTQNGNANIISEIILIDDASTVLPNIPFDKYDHLQLVRNTQNMGYVASVNKGCKMASGNLILLLDADAYVLSSLNDLLLVFQAKPSLGLVSFAVVNQWGQTAGKMEQAPGLLSIILGQKLEAKWRNYFKGSEKSACYYSFAIAFRKTVFEEFEGFDESFDFLDADIDFSIRFHQSQKWDSENISSILIQHDGGGSPQSTSKRVIRFYYNRIRLLKKNNNKWLVKVAIVLAWVRLVVEYFILKWGVKGNSEAVRIDKINGRKYLIKNLLYQL